MTRPIGYYVHHHGDGHRQRALAIANAAEGSFTLIGTGLAGRTAALDCMDLPDDRIEGRTFDGIDTHPARPHALHYAPVFHEGVRARVAQISRWIAQAKPRLMVVDVSVEIAMLARLAATPTVYVRLGGARTDVAHLEAFRGANALLAPFHHDLDCAMNEDWIIRKTRFCSGLTTTRHANARPDIIVVVQGRGGTVAMASQIAAAARATPAMQWRVLGTSAPCEDRPDNLAFLGWVDDPDPEIASAGIVVGGAGDGLVTSVIAAGRPFICLPQSRPFGEQLAKAQRLRALGAAVVINEWLEPREWPALIALARALDPAVLNRLHDPAGPRKAAEFILQVAEEAERHVVA